MTGEDLARCELCGRLAVLEVDVRRKLWRGGTQTKTWVICAEDRKVLDDRLAKLELHWTVVAERTIDPTD